MSMRNLLGLVALVPAALNIAVPAHAGITVLVCRGDGVVEAVTLPLGSGLPAPATESGCCAKACHGGSSRKRSNCHI